MKQFSLYTLWCIKIIVYLQGAHVTVHARTEDDVDVDDILKKVAKSSGANYSFHKEKPNPEMNAPAGPVVSWNPAMLLIYRKSVYSTHSSPWLTKNYI